MQIGNLKEEHLVLLIFGVVLILITFFFSSFGADTAPEPVGPDPVDPCLQAAVSANCEVKVEREFKDCTAKNRQRRIETLNALLAKPEESDVCEQSKLSLEGNCPKECVVDYSTLYQIAGDAEIQTISGNETTCLMAASRTLSMRANCTATPKSTGPKAEVVEEPGPQ